MLTEAGRMIPAGRHDVHMVAGVHDVLQHHHVAAADALVQADQLAHRPLLCVPW
jgi:hypothetical protein